MATHSSIFPGKCHGQRSLAGYGPWGCRKLDTTEARTSHTHTHTLVRTLSQIFTWEAVIISSTHEELGLENMPKLTDLTKSRAKIQAQFNLSSLSLCFIQ